jgi:hypothetical protein
MATTEEKVAAHRRLFEAVMVALMALEEELGVTPREARVGPLGEYVAIISSGASEGLQAIARHERQVAGS